MRIVAIVFGLLGVAGSGFLGGKWLSDINDKKAELELIRKMEEVVKTEEFSNKVREIDRHINATYGLLAGAALGFVAVILVMLGQTKFAGLLFLVALAIPVALLMHGKVLIFTFPLGLAALFALLARPRRVPARYRDRDRDRDED